MAKVANILTVKVYPKDFKAIPDILPYRQLLQGDPMELELDKKEIWRCINFGDVFDLTSGEEVLIDEIAWKAIEEFVEEEESEEGSEEEGGSEEEEEGSETDEEAEPAVVNGAITEDTVVTQ